MKFDLYQTITDKVLALLEAGTVPWRQPWKNREPPQNLLTRKAYRGINQFILNASPFATPYWLSLRQVNAAGGTVRKGEKASIVVFWKLRERRKKEPDDEHSDKKRIPLLRYYNVCNVSQCDGINPMLMPTPVEDFRPIERCEALVEGMPTPPKIVPHAGGASYSPAKDTVYMPDRVLFESSEAYYSVLFHELTHATGHGSRLDRKGFMEGARFGSDDYSREELVAEMGAAFLAGHCGIDAKTTPASADYIQSWLNRLRDDRKLVVFAAAQAQKACDFIRGLNFSESVDHDELAA